MSTSKKWRRVAVLLLGAAAAMISLSVLPRLIAPTPERIVYGGILPEAAARVSLAVYDDTDADVEAVLREALDEMESSGFGGADLYQKLDLYFEPDPSLWWTSDAEQTPEFLLLNMAPAKRRGEVGFEALTPSRGVRMLPATRAEQARLELARLDRG
ncbi:MAG: hypothetical protein AAFX79_09385 [Planctomycetota bacterium]